MPLILEIRAESDIQSYIDGSYDGTEKAELEEFVRASPEATALLLSYEQINSGLRELFRLCPDDSIFASCEPPKTN